MQLQQLISELLVRWDTKTYKFDLQHIHSVYERLICNKTSAIEKMYKQLTEAHCWREIVNVRLALVFVMESLVEAKSLLKA